jgi:hypothetical protein
MTKYCLYVYGRIELNVNSLRTWRIYLICVFVVLHFFLQGRDCFICKKSGHRAKNCPDKYNATPQSSKICLNCGESGHEMFSCKKDYSPDDLKVVPLFSSLLVLFFLPPAYLQVHILILIWISFLIQCLKFFWSSFRKYNATSARVLAIYVVLPLVMIVWDKFLATDVVNWVILVW